MVRLLKHKMCEGCSETRANYGLPADRKKRWCAGCSKGQEGTVSLLKHSGKGCGETRTSYGLPGRGHVALVRWLRQGTRRGGEPEERGLGGEPAEAEAVRELRQDEA